MCLAHGQVEPEQPLGAVTVLAAADYSLSTSFGVADADEVPPSFPLVEWALSRDDPMSSTNNHLSWIVSWNSLFCSIRLCFSTGPILTRIVSIGHV